MPRAKVIQFKVNLPPPLHKRIASAAKARTVPVNKEIVDRLERSFSQEDFVHVIRMQERAVSNFLLTRLVALGQDPTAIMAEMVNLAAKGDLK